MSSLCVCSTCAYVVVITLPESTGTLLAAVCHVQFSHSPPPSSDSTKGPGWVTVHEYSRDSGGPDPCPIKLTCQFDIMSVLCKVGTVQ